VRDTDAGAALMMESPMMRRVLPPEFPDPAEEEAAEEPDAAEEEDLEAAEEAFGTNM